MPIAILFAAVNPPPASAEGDVVEDGTSSIMTVVVLEDTGFVTAVILRVVPRLLVEESIDEELLSYLVSI
jgi:hypothetical protein